MSRNEAWVPFMDLDQWAPAMAYELVRLLLLCAAKRALLLRSAAPLPRRLLRLAELAKRSGPTGPLLMILQRVHRHWQRAGLQPGQRADLGPRLQLLLRVRPGLPRDEHELQFTVQPSGQQQLVTAAPTSAVSAPWRLKFDCAFVDGESTEQVYTAAIRSRIALALGSDGRYTIVCTGPEGSGRSYSLFGPEMETGSEGLLHMVARQVFGHSGEARVRFIDALNDQFMDWLHPSGGRRRQFPDTRAGGSSRVVNSPEELVGTVVKAQEAQLKSPGVVVDHELNHYFKCSHDIISIDVGAANISLVWLSSQDAYDPAIVSCLHAVSNNSTHVPCRNTKVTRALFEDAGARFFTFFATAHKSPSQEAANLKVLRVCDQLMPK